MARALRGEKLPVYASVGLPVEGHVEVPMTTGPGRDTRHAIEASKIRRELGWQPRHMVEEGLRAAVRRFFRLTPSASRRGTQRYL